MAKRTPKRSKELRRIKQFISRAEKRGYKFNPSFINSLESKTTRSLQLLTARKLYENAEYITQEGNIYNGLQGRGIERELSAKKAQITRAQKKRERERERLEEEGYQYVPPVSDIIYQNVLNTIDEYPSSEGAQYLTNLLNSEIKKYGLNTVLYALNKAGERVIRLAQEIVYYELNSNQLHSALQMFSDLIRSGEIMSKEENKEFNEVLESISNES